MKHPLIQMNRVPKLHCVVAENLLFFAEGFGASWGWGVGPYPGYHIRIKCIDCIYFIVKCVKMYVTSFQSYHFTLFLMHFTGSWTSILTFMMQYSSELTWKRRGKNFSKKINTVELPVSLVKVIFPKFLNITMTTVLHIKHIIQSFNLVEPILSYSEVIFIMHHIFVYCFVLSCKLYSISIKFIFFNIYLYLESRPTNFGDRSHLFTHVKGAYEFIRM